MVSRRSATALRTASAGSHMSGRSRGSAIFISDCARGFSASLASAASAADLTATLAPSKARSPAHEASRDPYQCLPSEGRPPVLSIITIA